MCWSFVRHSSRPTTLVSWSDTMVEPIKELQCRAFSEREAQEAESKASVEERLEPANYRMKRVKRAGYKQ